MATARGPRPSKPSWPGRRKPKPEPGAPVFSFDPVIVLFTDFGWRGPYVGQMKAVLAEAAPEQPVIDLLHDAPVFDPLLAAHLLAAHVDCFPAGSVFCAVVDPGVGSEREALVVRADSRYFVGPDNGLFDVLAARAAEAAYFRIHWRPEHLSNSFHGRDLFAPVAARLARGEAPEALALPLWRRFESSMGADLAKIIYIDEFGNAMTGLRARTLSCSDRVRVAGQRLAYARTFAEVSPGQPFWYPNSVGLVEIAVNRGSAADLLGLALGDALSRA